MNPFEHTTVVAFELSNACNFAWLHPQCPLHQEMLSPFTVRDPQVLPTNLIAQALNELGAYGWSGIVNFHGYNEPLLDPRLCELVRRTRETLPSASIQISTNGYLLNGVLAEELRAAGVNGFHVTLYGSKEDHEAQAARFIQQMPRTVMVHVGTHALDDRATIYDRAEYKLTRPCGAPLEFVTVTCRAQVGLCCFDWKRTATFGDLNRMSLGEALASEQAQETYRRLKAGDRFLDVCKRCNTARGV